MCRRGPSSRPSGAGWSSRRRRTAGLWGADATMRLQLTPELRAMSPGTDPRFDPRFWRGAQDGALRTPKVGSARLIASVDQRAELSPGSDVELDEDVPEVVLDRLHRDIELGRHLAVDEPGRHQSSHGELGSAESEECGWALGRCRDLESGQLGGADLDVGVGPQSRRRPDELLELSDRPGSIIDPAQASAIVEADQGAFEGHGHG